MSWTLFYQRPEGGRRRIVGHVDRLPSREVTDWLVGSLHSDKGMTGSGEYLGAEHHRDGRVLWADDGDWYEGDA